MAKRYDAWLAYDAAGAYVAMDDADDGCFVTCDDYAALQAENERLKSVISGARSVASSWRCVGGAYIRGCCKEVVLGACDDILEHIDAHKGE